MQSEDQQRLADAIASWKDRLGDENVIDSRSDLGNVASNTYGHPQMPGAVVRPGSTDEVREVVLTASKYRVPLYPISCGKNWGYGDASPVRPGQVVVDLSRMNRILEVNADLAYAIVEPGVTQGQLYDYLNEHDLPLWLDATGAGPHASVLGNVIERGFGHTTVADHFACSCCYEVVLSTGEVIETGFGRYHDGTARHTYKPGVGVSLDGLFTQGNLGIVTRMTIWLMARPEALRIFALKFDSEATLIRAIPILRHLKMQGILQNTLHIANDLRVLSSNQSHPGPPLSIEHREQLRRESWIGAWSGLGALYGDSAVIRGQCHSLRRALRGIARPIFIDDTKVAFGRALARVMPNCALKRSVNGRIEAVTAVLDILRGRPVREPMRGVYWKVDVGDVREIDDPDPSDPRVGLYWLCPLLAFEPHAAEDVIHKTESTLLEHGFDPLITLSLVNERSLAAIISINFDRRDEAACARAKACFELLSKDLYASGYPPYRTGTAGMSLLDSNSSTTYWDVVSRLKRSIDPRAILAPGRYDPSTLDVGD